jgi:polyisoprenyl-teichoic acid--peptidoglycan teichoic acid transferase
LKFSWMKRLASLFCAFVLLLTIMPAALGENDPEVSFIGDDIKKELDAEDLAQWEQWDKEDATAPQADAEASIAPEELDAEHQKMLSDLGEGDIANIDLSVLEANPDLPGDYVNILLLGVDSRTNVLNTGLSDVIMILSINKTTGEIKLSSIARDTCVAVPGYKNAYRINVAYAFGSRKEENGGPKLAMRTVNRNFQMNVERFVAINFFGLAAIIDSLGGVDIELTKAEANRINYELRKEPLDDVKRAKVEGVAGMHHLDGMQAVTYARLRKIDSDFMRTARQRKLLEVLLNQVMQNMDMNRMMDLLNAVLPYVYTNISVGEMFELGTTVLKSDLAQKVAAGEPLIEQHRVPMDKTFGYKDVNGASLVYMNDKNFKTNVEALQEFIYGQSYYK